MHEILRAWWESVRNSVQAWDSRSMRKSWQPCDYIPKPRLIDISEKPRLKGISEIFKRVNQI